MRGIEGRGLAAAVAAVVVGLGAAAPGCGGGGSGGGAVFPTVSGVVYGYTEDPLRAVPVRLLGGAAGATGVSGLFALGTTGDGVVRVGDSITTPTLLVPFTRDGAFTHLDRPIYLPSLESGIGANLPASVSVSTTIEGDALPGVALDVAAGTTVSVPTGAPTEVRVVGVSPSRLPAPLPGGLAPRVAFLVEPFGTTFSTDATLRVPRLDASAGPFDAWQVSTTTGEWEQVATGIPLVGDEVSIPIEVGTLVTVVPSAAPPATVDLTGRIVAGTQPVAGFRASCWNLASEPTGADGTFVIEDVPTSYGIFYVRAYPARPGVDFAPTVTTFASGSSALGDLGVTARVPDLIEPFVRTTSPSDGQLSVGPEVQVVVTFSEAIDRSLPEPVELRGRTGKVAVRLNYDNAFTVRLIPTQLLDLSERYTILVDTAVTDLAGNPLDATKIAYDFTTRGGAPATPPTDTVSFGIAPLSAVRGDTVSILGRNFTGNSSVTVGSTLALVTAESDEEVRFTAPDFQPAGDVTVSLSAGGVGVGALRPLVLDLRAQVLNLYEGATPDAPLVVVDRAAPPAVFVASGANIGGTAVTVDGLSIAAIDSTEVVSTTTVTTGRTISLPTPAPATLLTGPVVVRGSNGKAGATYRFLQVRE